ncbi:pre-RNA processing PIH1/Nop17-domain-containing protein [Epithele typhae]|uniref:pre-RNA processing PIH1/Nop17-domain-containing protein n=1 Tax=Epithele typhae TaxID=378194 RepID=UPI002008D15A|nr:pre-RNA processing PIH1/Nop17-domain-containing protein [Epithele typhae]KAH9922346.1 pre-RNA processing PIH1/Nop17-domain-containing protein [Epithele typhae]
MAATRSVDLAPVPGFCVKSTASKEVSLAVAVAPGALTQPLRIPAGLKVFVNVGWDANVPGPTEETVDGIERAVSSNAAISPASAASWFVPLVISDPRPDTDKAGKPSVVLDAIFNSSLKSRALRSPELKTYLIELAFEQIEAQHGLLLSRQIGTPNIASKGKLWPRAALVPTAPGALVEELPPPTVPALEWATTAEGGVSIALSVPHLTRAAIPATTVDLEPRRLLFATPALPGSPAPAGYALDLDLDLPDPDLLARFPASGQQALALKHQRPFAVDAARAEWRVADRTFVLYA